MFQLADYIGCRNDLPALINNTIGWKKESMNIEFARPGK